MNQSVRAINVSPEFFMLATDQAARLLREYMAREPADLWLVVVGPPESAARIMEGLFIYGPAEPEEIDGPTGE